MRWDSDIALTSGLCAPKHQPNITSSDKLSFMTSNYSKYNQLKSILHVSNLTISFIINLKDLQTDN